MPFLKRIKGFLFILLFVLTLDVTANQKIGSIHGLAQDQSTRQPLKTVFIQIVGNNQLSAISDDQGKFTLPEVPIGTYRIKATSNQYEPLIKTDVVVSTGRQVFIEMNLKHLAFTLEEVQVKPNFFDKPVGTNTSTRTLSSEEIRRSPGGLEDVNRVMMSMPGIVRLIKRTI